MRKDDLLDSFEMIDEKLIEEASFCQPEPKKRRFSIRRILLPAAAALALVPLLYAVLLNRAGGSAAKLPAELSSIVQKGDNAQTGKTDTEEPETIILTLLEVFCQAKGIEETSSVTELFPDGLSEGAPVHLYECPDGVWAMDAEGRVAKECLTDQTITSAFLYDCDGDGAEELLFTAGFGAESTTVQIYRPDTGMTEAGPSYSTKVVVSGQEVDNFYNGLFNDDGELMVTPGDDPNSIRMIEVKDRGIRTTVWGRNIADDEALILRESEEKPGELEVWLAKVLDEDSEEALTGMKTGFTFSPEAKQPDSNGETSIREGLLWLRAERNTITLTSFGTPDEAPFIAMTDVLPGNKAQILLGMSKEDVMARFSAISMRGLTEDKENLVSIACEDSQEIESVDLLFNSDGILRMAVYYPKEEETPELFSQWLLTLGEAKNVENTVLSREETVKGVYCLHCAESAEKLFKGDEIMMDEPDGNIPFVYAELVSGEPTEGKEWFAIGADDLFCQSSASWLAGQNEAVAAIIGQWWDGYTYENLCSTTTLNQMGYSLNDDEVSEILALIGRVKEQPDLYATKTVPEEETLSFGKEAEPIFQTSMRFAGGDQLVLTVYQTGGFLSVFHIDDKKNVTELTLVLSGTIVSDLLAFLEDNSMDDLIEVPSLTGKNVNTYVIPILKEKGLTYTVTWEVSEKPVFTVLSQSPTDGTVVKKDTAIALTVSRGQSLENLIQPFSE